jgi:ABC-type multidrug transport system fused ATPase/permease subunit
MLKCPYLDAELRPSLLALPLSISQLLQELLGAQRIGTFLQSQNVDYLMEFPTNGRAQPDAEELYIRGTIAWNISEDYLGASDTSSRESSVSAVTQMFQLRDLDVNFPRGEMTLIAGKFGSGKTLVLLALLGEARLVEGSISYPHETEPTEWSLQ